MPGPVVPSVQRLHATALAALTAGHLSEARRLVEAGLAGEPSPVERAELVRLRARLLTWSGPIAMDAWLAVVDSAEKIAGDEPELAAAMLCDAAVLAAYTRQLDLAEQLAERALVLTGGEGVTGALAATGLGLTYGLTGRFEQAAPLLARADGLLDADHGVVEAAAVLLPAVLAHVVQEEYGAAMACASRFLAGARPLGAVGLLPLPLCLLAHAGWKAGRWEEARLAAAEALSLAVGTQEPALELYAQAMLALVAGGQGREQACQERVERTLAMSDSTGIGMFRVTVQMARVHLALGHDRPADALEPLDEVDALMSGQRRAGMLSWHADRIDVLVRLGRLDEARQVLPLLENDAADSRWEAAALLRCRGQLETDDARAVELLEASVEAFSWQPYEQARSRLRLAERLQGLDEGAARESAAEAHRAFSGLRAAAWAAQAETLLGGTVPTPVLRRRASDWQAAPAFASVAPTPAAATPSLEVRLLGDFAVLRGGEPVSLAAGTGAQALKYVAIRGGRAHVDELVEALWPGAEPGRGRTRLRNVLTRLRQDGELLVRDGDSVALPPGAVCDMTAFLDASTRGLAGDDAAAVHATALYSGELLPGDRYQDWTSGARERLRGRYLQLLDRLAISEAAAGNVDDALTWWERAVDVEPYDEDRYVAMASLLLLHGRTGPANRVLRRAHAMLDRLGVSPSQSLLDLGMPAGA